MYHAAVITVSDSGFRSERTDISGPAVIAILERNGFSIARHILVPDEQDAIENALRELSEQARLVVTTGGTGVAPRDVTPEATRAVCTRILEGFAEVMRAEGRKQTQFASLSRAVSGIRGTTLIVNLPGSPQGAATSLTAVMALIPHVLMVLDGAGTPHGH